MKTADWLKLTFIEQIAALHPNSLVAWDQAGVEIPENPPFYIDRKVRTGYGARLGALSPQGYYIPEDMVFRCELIEAPNEPLGVKWVWSLTKARSVNDPYPAERFRAELDAMRSAP